MSGLGRVEDITEALWVTLGSNKVLLFIPK